MHTRVITISLIVSTIIYSLAQFIPNGVFTSLDYIEYYSAFKLFISEKNPYDALELLKIQQSLGRDAPKPLMMWNPPWLLLLMAPVLFFPFVLSNLAWLVTNVVLVVLALHLYCIADDRRLPENKALLFSAIFIFFPFVNCLLMGQIACLLTLLLSILYYGLKKGNDLLVGVSWFFLSVKPHLFIFLSVYLFIIVLKSGRFRILLYVFLSLFAGLLITTFVNEHVIAYWFDAHVFGVNIEEVTRVDNHKTTTFVYALQTLLYRMNLGVHNWPFIVVPLVPLIFYAFYIKNKASESLISSKEFNLSLILSFMFSPFAWIFDFVPIIFVSFEIIVAGNLLQSGKRKGMRLILIVALLNLFSFFIDAFSSVGLHHYMFYVPVMLLLWIEVYRKKINNVN